jgi:hypothetical protein
MSNFPLLNDGKTTRQSVKRTLSLNTKILRYLDSSEQRYVSRTPVQRLEGAYNNLVASEYTNGTTGLQDFHDQMLGRYDNFNIAFNGHTYTNFYFDSDKINFTEASYNLYKTQLVLKQFPSAGFPTITVSDPNLPTLGNGTNGPLTQWPSQLYHKRGMPGIVLQVVFRAGYCKCRLLQTRR